MTANLFIGWNILIMPLLLSLATLGDSMLRWRKSTVYKSTGPISLQSMSPHWRLVGHFNIYADSWCADKNTVDLVTADLVTADLVTADLVTADLVTADLVTADLVTADLVTADLVTATADLVTADLVTADLVTADLVTADLVTADLVTADLVAADLVTADYPRWHKNGLVYMSMVCSLILSAAHPLKILYGRGKLAAVGPDVSH